VRAGTVRALKLDPFSGISGDMFAGTMVQLVDSEEEILEIPSLLGLGDVEIRLDWVERSSLRARKFDVLYRGTLADDVVGDHGHRHLSEILELLESATLDRAVRDRAVDMFNSLGEAEVASHGGSLETIHFHETGALDSIVDVVAAAWLIERASVELILCEPICTGFGMVSTAHGELPVPGPATDHLLRGYPVRAGCEEGEMTTPTGAAILKHLEPSFERPLIRVLRTAVGAGTKDLAGRPNVLRASICEIESGVEATNAELSSAVLIETNIDDMPGELLGEDLVTRLLEAGALDVVLHHVTMKKGRPGIQLEVLGPPGSEETLSNLLLEHTSTLGVRVIPVRRHTLPRTRVEVETVFGSIGIKQAELPNGEVRGFPEFEDCRRAAERAGVSVQRVYSEASSAYSVAERSRRRT
jgi:uncharacterized protein (TIGR00299 family) protein